MGTGPSRRRLLASSGAALCAATGGCLGFGGGRSPTERVRDRRSALEEYRDVAVALEDGYRMTTPYVRSGDGVLGLPFVHSGAPELDPSTPNVLFYDLDADGSYRLLGVEWLVPAEDRSAPPSLFGREFHPATPGETAFIPEHYGLHVWLFEENPAGLFARRHTGVAPPPFVDELEAAWGSLEGYFADDAAAVAAGYERSDRCVATPDGGYGFAFVDPSRRGTDPTAPTVLLYRFSSSWSFRLVGAEWSVPAGDADEPPSLFGRRFHEPAGPHDAESSLGRHYGLHVWLYAANPRGTFARFNPAVDC